MRTWKRLVGLASSASVIEAGTYRTVARLLDLRADDDLLDIGCGPGGFLDAETRHAHRAVGIDASPLMLRAASRRLADRITAGTVKLVQGNAASLPFGEAEFSAAVAIYAPVSPPRLQRSGAVANQECTRHMA